jgi:imidazolonepropionase-like amidohydrolase
MTTTANPHDVVLGAAELLDDKLVPLPVDGGRTVLRGGTVLDGVGGVHRDADIVIEGSRIASVGPAGAVPGGARVLDAAGLTVLPGLIDAHIHFMGKMTTHESLAHLYPSPNLKMLRSAFQLYETLASGVTTVRALGHGVPEHTYALRAARAEGLIRGPRIQTSGWALSQSRGHGDVPGLPYEWVERNRPRAAFADGELECRRLVRRNFGEGADVIKVYSSDNRTGRPDFTLDELTAIVDEAHRRGRPVATHAKTYEGVRNALLAGIDTIEHGTSEVHADLLDMMAERGAYLVPTLATVHRLAVEGHEWAASEATIERCKRELEGRQRVVEEAAKRGVQIVTGSDAAARGGYGLLSTRELALLVDSGLSTKQALAAATSVAARALRLDDHIGVVAPGKAADLLVVDGDPLTEIGLLQDRTRLRLILQAGDPLTN